MSAGHSDIETSRIDQFHAKEKGELGRIALDLRTLSNALLNILPPRCEISLVTSDEILVSVSQRSIEYVIAMGADFPETGTHTIHLIQEVEGVACPGPRDAEFSIEVPVEEFDREVPGIARSISGYLGSELNEESREPNTLRPTLEHLLP